MREAEQPRNDAAPDAVAPPPRHPRFPLIDGLRAIAALAILLVHVALFSDLGSGPLRTLLIHLNVGVPIFFVISGFVLYRPMIAHRAGGPSAPPVRSYAWRRFLRIFPAYWLVLTVLTVLPGTTGVSNGNWLTQYAMVHTLPIGNRPGCVASLDCALAQTWSLVPEITFYAFLPLYALLAARLARGSDPARWARAELAALATLAAASVALHFTTLGTGAASWVLGTAAGTFLWFAMGMALAVLSVLSRGPGRPPRLARAIADRPGVTWALAATVYVVLCVHLPENIFVVGDGDLRVAHIGFALVAVLVVAPAVFGEPGQGRSRQALDLRLFSWLGLISYGIFLWHYAVVLEFGSSGRGWSFLPLLAITIAITTACAAASYYLLERPVLRFKYRRPRPSRSAVRRPGPG